MNRADRAYKDALKRWSDECADLSDSAVMAAIHAWDDGRDECYGKDEAALILLVAEIIQARDDCPGEDHDWQHAVLLAARAVRAAGLLAKRRAYRRPKKKRGKRRGS